MVAADKNLSFYTAHYDSLKVEPLVEMAKNLDFFRDAVTKHTSWYGLYQEGFAERLAGRRVLELGAGEGLNALIMARLGADVTAIEIAPRAVEVLQEASRRLGLNVKAICGDFLNFSLPSFDIIVGKAFLHHLDHELEDRFLQKCSQLLTPDGEARFQEPAINSRLLDSLRWVVPAPGRPSILQSRAFAAWKEEDPHPERDQSSLHYEKAGRKHFEEVRILAFGALERFRRLIRDRNRSSQYARWALQAERRYLPQFLQHTMARSQTIIYSRPKARAGV